MRSNFIAIRQTVYETNIPTDYTSHKATTMTKPPAKLAGTAG